MKTVIMTVGPQGAGKTTFCEKAVVANPDIKLISVDTFFMEKFGKLGFDPYTGEVHYAWDCFWGHLAECVASMGSKATVLLDCWNPTKGARNRIRERLESYGAERVVAWYFVTTTQTCGRWFGAREHARRRTSLDLLQEMSSRNARIFHKDAEDVRQGVGFDAVHFIDPQQLRLFPEIFPI